MGKVPQLNVVPARTKTAPVRIKLERINCDVGKLHPPDGSHQEWVARLQAALLAEAERGLHQYVLRAYRIFCNRSQFLN